MKHGWLRSEGSGHQKRYFQTEAFKAIQVEPKLVNVDIEIASDQGYSVLTSEYNHYKRELEVVLGEINEYRSLNKRFPELEPKLVMLLKGAKERSVQLLGKVNGLKSVLRVLDEKNQTC